MKALQSRKATTLVVALFFVILGGLILVMDAVRGPNTPLTREIRYTFFSQLDPFRAGAIENPPFPSITYSVQTFLWWDEAHAPLQLAWVNLMSFTHVKQSFAWKNVQPQPDLWTWGHADRMMNDIEQKNLNVIVRLGVVPDWAHPDLPSLEDEIFKDAPPDDLDLWRTYCFNIADRYQGRIAGYQIWNEPNLAREWGNQRPDALGYVELLRVCSEAIREADPSAVIISAGLAPNGQYDDMAHTEDRYLQAMYDAGFQDYVDVVGAHVPGYTYPEYGPDDAERDGLGRWQSFRRIEDLRKITIRNGDATRQMAILEMGYTTDRTNPVYSWFSVSEEEQAMMMAEAYAYIAENWRPWVGLVSSIYIANPIWTPEDEEFWWAFNDPVTGRMRPVFGAMAQMEKFCGDVYLPPRDPWESAVALEHNPCN